MRYITRDYGLQERLNAKMDLKHSQKHSLMTTFVIVLMALMSQEHRLVLLGNSIAEMLDIVPFQYFRLG
ncbi:hypothetical protein Ccrd_007076 [Cynara cardunculus var. scolymus]|uniref:Uncharacterized protein n=1 Tax=Cynara cardunculus var. scolymus TaxID=59895 RepID=A0A103XHR1_CYNCS|nr:hypothetical protein Ccrd_007076 [Cynara cardunculus var. scolymus]